MLTPLLSRDSEDGTTRAGVQAPPPPGTQFRQAREALGLGPAAARRPPSGAAPQHGAADETLAIRRVAFESPDPAGGGSPAMAARTPPALKAGYTPLTKEYLQVQIPYICLASSSRHCYALTSRHSRSHAIAVAVARGHQPFSTRSTCVTLT